TSSPASGPGQQGPGVLRAGQGSPMSTIAPVSLARGHRGRKRRTRLHHGSLWLNASGWRHADHREGAIRRPTLTPRLPDTMVNRMVKSPPQVLDRAFSPRPAPTRGPPRERLGRGPATISELAHPFGISLPGLLKHVRILEQADLVTTEKHGRTRQRRLGSEDLDDATQWIQTYRSRWEGRLGRAAHALLDAN